MNKTPTGYSQFHPLLTTETHPKAQPHSTNFGIRTSALRKRGISAGTTSSAGASRFSLEEKEKHTDTVKVPEVEKVVPVLSLKLPRKRTAVVSFEPETQPKNVYIEELEESPRPALTYLQKRQIAQYKSRRNAHHRYPTPRDTIQR